MIHDIVEVTCYGCVYFLGTFQCPGMYKCHGTNSCIPLANICDNQRQCPRGDDEWLCNIRCPAGCQCAGLTYFCTGRNFTRLPDNIPSTIRKLDMKENIVSLESIQFDKFHLLGELILSFNNIKEIPPNTFIKLFNLYFLDLSNNDIHMLQNGTFKGLSNLKELKLDGNINLYLVLPFAFIGLTNLPMLNLSYLNLNTVGDDSFNGLRSLAVLDLSNNNISSITAAAFRGLSEVSKLSISSNDINVFADTMFFQLPSLTHLNSDDFKYCCLVRGQVNEANCEPKKDALSSCDDLIGRTVLKVFMWAVGGCAFLGNMFVIILRIVKKERNQIYSFFVMNLAVADFFMGFYMIVIASVDQYYSGRYIQNATIWRKSWLCSALGFANSLSSEMSVITLFVISAERFFKIVFPYKGSLNMKSACFLMVIAWCISIFISALPLMPIDYFGGEFYSRSGVCISIFITNNFTPGWEYSVFVYHGLNFSLFVLIFLAYAYMYIQIQRIGAEAGRQAVDIALARRMTLVVASDFLCWIPINLLGNLQCF